MSQFFSSDDIDGFGMDGGAATYTDAEMQRQQDIIDDANDDLQDLNEQETGTNRADDQPWSPAYMNAMPGFSDTYSSASRRRDEATAKLQRMREANAMVPDATAAMIALANTTAPGATVVVAPAAASDASGYNSDDTIGFPSPPPGGLAPQGSPVNDDDDRTPAEMGMVPFSPRFYETPDEDMGGDGVTGGAHDAERRALRVAKNDLAHRRRILTRFDTWEDDSWLDPDRLGPPLGPSPGLPVSVVPVSAFFLPSANIFSIF